MSLERVGVVLIGRNEGARLREALQSVPPTVGALVYVDSGSSDDSVQVAAGAGAKVVELDPAAGFTAARGRNEGARWLRANHPDHEYIQFIDGDCRLVDGWLVAACERLDRQADVAAVCGARREQFGDASVFNTICDVEWNQATPGVVHAFAGDVMIRADVLFEVGGYNEAVIAAEDDELSIRVRAAGHTIERLDHDMTLHDVAMTSVRQWWKRAERAGYGYALVNRLHGGPPERYFEPQLRRAVLWGLVAPLTALGLGRSDKRVTVGVAALYGLRGIRVARSRHRAGWRPRVAAAWGVSCVASSFPQVTGIAKFIIDRLRRRGPEIIEYK